MTHEPRDTPMTPSPGPASERAYLVYYFEAYEMPCEPVVAFSTRADAEAFAVACREYDKTQPQVPEIDDDDKLWVRWRRAQKRWEKHHPAKVTTCAPAGYDVRELELRRAP